MTARWAIQRPVIPVTPRQRVKEFAPKARAPARLLVPGVHVQVKADQPRRSVTARTTTATVKPTKAVSAKTEPPRPVEAMTKGPVKKAHKPARTESGRLAQMK